MALHEGGYPFVVSAVLTNEPRNERCVRGGGGVAFSKLTLPRLARPRQLATNVNGMLMFWREDSVSAESGIRKRERGVQ